MCCADRQKGSRIEKQNYIHLNLKCVEPCYHHFPSFKSVLLKKLNLKAKLLNINTPIIMGHCAKNTKSIFHCSKWIPFPPFTYDQIWAQRSESRHLSTWRRCDLAVNYLYVGRGSWVMMELKKQVLRGFVNEVGSRLFIRAFKMESSRGPKSTKWTAAVFNA